MEKIISQFQQTFSFSSFLTSKCDIKLKDVQMSEKRFLRLMDVPVMTSKLNKCLEVF